MFEDPIFEFFSVRSTSVPLVIIGVPVLLYLVYQWALPKPIPGIPYNEASKRRLLGDVPDMIAHVNKTQTIWPWVSAQALKLNSPIIQLWTRPFAKPWVMVYDFQESQDILLRRTKEFDRAKFFGDLFLGLLPNHHLTKQSSDPGFKHNRALLKDLMTPGFLHAVVAPQIYNTIETLLELWSTKIQLVKGHPFAADDDIFHGALDAIFAATFGLETEDSMLYKQKQFLHSIDDIVLPADTDKPAICPECQRPPKFDAILTLTESLEITMKSPFPRWHYWFLRQLPYMRNAIKIKEDTITYEIQRAVERVETNATAYQSAVDDVLRRERGLAEKEERPPVYHSRDIHDEVSFQILV
jgi:hypothetical protein